MNKKMIAVALRTFMGACLAFGADAGLCSWEDALQSVRPHVLQRERATAADIAARALGGSVARTGEWSTPLSADGERMDVCTFVASDGSRNSFAVYLRNGWAGAYYWTAEGVAGGRSVADLLEGRGLVGAESSACMADGVLSSDDVAIADRGVQVPIPYERFHFVFIDDRPGANWAHPCKYVFISEDLSSFAVMYKMMPPRLVDRATNGRIGLSTVLKEAAVPAAPKSLEALKNSVYSYANGFESNALTYSAGDKSKSYFVLISGGEDAEGNGIRFWFDTAMMYSTLTKKYGVSKDKIFVYVSDGTSTAKDANLGDYENPVLVDSPRDLDGDGVSDIDGASNRSTITAAFTSLAGQLKSDDQLFVFVTSHGGPSWDGGVCACMFNPDMSNEAGYDWIEDYELSDWTKNMKCPVAFLVETCYSGGFVDDICKTANRVIATACNDHELSYGTLGYGMEEEWDGLGKTHSYNKFAAPFISAFRGCQPAGYYGWGHPWEDSSMIANADANGNGLVSFKEAWTYACANDEKRCTLSSHSATCGTDNKVEHPQYGESTSGLGGNFYVLKQSSVPPPSTDPFGLDSPLPFETAGQASWFKVTQSGISYAQSGTIADYQESRIQTTVTGPCSVSFWWKVSSEANYDELRFYIDSTVQDKISGEVDWNQKTFSVPSGSHKLVWSYVKDGSQSGGSDCGCLDRVSVTSQSKLWTVKYHSNNGKNLEASQQFVKDQSQRLLYMDSQIGWEYKDGDGFNYVFLGWAKSSTGAVAYENGQAVKNLVEPGKVMHLYAVWQKRAYNVCFHSNDGRGKSASQEFRPGIAKNLLWIDSGLGWTRVGYDFLGWAKSPTADVAYANGATVKDLVPQGQTLHLYGVWRERTYNVCYHSNDGRDKSAVQKIRLGLSWNLFWLDSGLGWTRSGYDFLGWAKSPSGGVVYANGAAVKNLVAENKTMHLYAVWRERKWFVCFHRNYGASATADQPIAVGASERLYWIDSQLGWSRNGYWFKGWAKSPTADPVYDNGEIVKDLVGTGQTLHLYGAWGKKTK